MVQITVSRTVLLWLLAMALLSPLAVAVIGVVYTDHVEQRTAHSFSALEQQNDRRWCALLAAIDVPVSPQIIDPIQRTRSQQIVKFIHLLRIDLRCIKA